MEITVTGFRKKETQDELKKLVDSVGIELPPVYYPSDPWVDDLMDIIEPFRDISKKLEQRRIDRDIEIRESGNNFIANQAWLCWKKDDIRFYLCESPLHTERERMKLSHPDLYEKLTYIHEAGRFNGYCHFPVCPTVAPGRDGILSYVTVHGGMTFFQEWQDGSMTYGFDTAHFNSEELGPLLDDLEWLMAECERMAYGIKVAARFEPYYLKARTNKAKARVLDRMTQFMHLDVYDNTGVILKILGGDL